MKCPEEYVYSERVGKCIESPIPNCLSIDSISGKCSECSNGFYLSQNQCLKSNSISNCLEYDPNSLNSCLTCGPNSSKKLIKSCKLVNNKVKNCKRFSNADSCQECEEGFFLPDCEPILFSENCLVKQTDENLCLKCNDRSFMYKDNCYYKQDLGLEACTHDGFDLTNMPFVCSFCENSSELLTVNSFNASCGIEKFQDFFGGKCISAKINSNGKSIFFFNFRKPRVYSMSIWIFCFRLSR